MNKVIPAILFALIILGNACNNRRSGNAEIHVNTIKFLPQDQSTVFIEDIADTVFFRVLSTEQDFLLSYIQEIYFSDSLMIIPQRSEGVVYLYDLAGNPVRKINPIGRSAGKLLSITDVWYNEGTRLIDVYDRRLGNVLSFDLIGKLIQEEKLKKVEMGVVELGFARSKNITVFERINAAGGNAMRLGIYNPGFKFQNSFLDIPKKIKKVNYGRTHVFEVYRDSMYYLPFLETRILEVNPEGISTAYEFDIPKRNRAPDEYMNQPGGEMTEYIADIGTTDFIHSFEMLYMTDKYISFNYNKGGSLDRNNVFFSKKTKNVLQFSNWKSRELPGMELLSVIRGVNDNYFVIVVDATQNHYLPESIQKELNYNSNPVLLFFKFKDF